jgi:berberine-like enzyme
MALRWFVTVPRWQGVPPPETAVLQLGLHFRCREGLDRVGVIERRPNPGGKGSLYYLTAAGQELVDVAIRRHSDDEVAFSGRDAEFTININCGATDADLYARDRTWVREWFDPLTPHSAGGMYVNFIPEDGGQGIREVYGQSKYRRLSEIKSHYDPENILQVSHNIKPV